MATYITHKSDIDIYNYNAPSQTTPLKTSAPTKKIEATPTMPTATGLNIYAAGFLSGMIGSKGDLKQGLLGVLTAGFNAKVLYPMKASFRKLIAHGLTGGVRSRLSGGSFKSGFLGSAVNYGASWSGAYKAAGISNQANTWTQRVQNVVASYVVGGVAAELGGGKFANGGMSVAFSRMFNDLHIVNSHHKRTT